MEERKKLIVYLAVLITLIVVLSSLYIYRYTFLSPLSTDQLEECKTLSNPGGTINLLFFSTKDEAEKYSSYLMSKQPFRDQSQNFAIRYIDTYKPTCDLYKDTAILCYSKELIQKAASCPNDYIFVTDSRDSSIRSSSYMGVMSINLNHPMSVVLHEFGHAFANFAEEYAPAKIPAGSKNCVSSCDKFGGYADNCFQECSNADYFRSIDEGIMRTLNVETYGDYNNQVIEQKITSSKSTLSGRAVDNTIPCEEQKYLLVTATYDGQSINVINKELKAGCAAGTDSGPLTYKVVDAGIVIATNSFNPEPIFTDAPNAHKLSGETYTNTEPFYLALPVQNDQESVNFFDGDTQIGSLNLQDLYSYPCQI